ncbi:hypothetical protein [Vibrio phage RYC]|nr:hypothetical protein [Vibrio phage RYC]
MDKELEEGLVFKKGALYKLQIDYTQFLLEDYFIFNGEEFVPQESDEFDEVFTYSLADLAELDISVEEVVDE